MSSLRWTLVQHQSWSLGLARNSNLPFLLQILWTEKGKNNLKRSLQFNLGHQLASIMDQLPPRWMIKNQEDDGLEDYSICKVVIFSTLSQWAKSWKKVHLGRTMHCLPQRLKSTFFEIFSSLQVSPLRILHLKKFQKFQNF